MVILLEGFIKRYLNKTNNELGVVIPIDQISIGTIEVEIMKFLDKNFNNRFRIELLMMPSWAGKCKVFKINNNYFTHIKIKSVGGEL